MLTISACVMVLQELEFEVKWTEPALRKRPGCCGYRRNDRTKYPQPPMMCAVMTRWHCQWERESAHGRRNGASVLPELTSRRKPSCRRLWLLDRPGL